MVINLLTNAVKYSTDNTLINVRVTRDGAESEVCVTDHGLGIPVEDLDKIFTLYFRGSNVAASGARRGVGIGLYISKNIIDRHQGSIGVSSTLGMGSAFYFRLPIIGERSQGTPA